VDRAERQQFARALLGVRVELVPALRQPQAQVKTLGVDRFQFPFERVRPACPVASGEAGHARQRHGVKVSGKTKRVSDSQGRTRARTIRPFQEMWSPPCSGMILSENRFTLSRIMPPYCWTVPAAGACAAPCRAAGGVRGAAGRL